MKPSKRRAWYSQPSRDDILGNGIARGRALALIVIAEAIGKPRSWNNNQGQRADDKVPRG